MSDLISREAVLKRVEYSSSIYELEKEKVVDLITTATAIEQGENVDYLEIENIAQMAGLLVDTPRGLAWEFADIEKLTKFANICAERRYLPNTASTVSQNEQQEVVGYIDEFGNFENSLKQWMVEEPDVKWRALYTTPQQPQEQDEFVKKAVADALEEAAKICDVNLMSWADDKWNGAAKDCAKRIRALIKCDAEGVE